MAYLVAKGGSGKTILSGSQYFLDPNMGKARLKIRTGSSADDVLQYGWTTDITASKYSPIKAVIKCGATAYVGMRESGSKSVSYAVTTGTSYHTSSFTSTNTIQSTRSYQSTTSNQTTTTYYDTATRSSAYNTTRVSDYFVQSTSKTNVVGQTSRSTINDTELVTSVYTTYKIGTTTSSNTGSTYINQGFNISTIVAGEKSGSFNVTLFTRQAYTNTTYTASAATYITARTFNKSVIATSYRARITKTNGYTICYSSTIITSTTYNCESTRGSIYEASRISTYTSNTRFGTRKLYTIKVTTSENYLTGSSSTSTLTSNHNFNI